MILPPIFWVAVFLSAGIASGEPLNSKISHPLVPILPAFLLILFSMFFRKISKLFWICFLFGVFLSGISLHYFKFVSFNKLSYGPAKILGTIDSFPVQIQRNQRHRVRFKFNCKYLQKLQGEWIFVGTKILVTVPNSSKQLKYGDKLVLQGEMIKSTARKNPGSFDPESYLMRSGLGGIFTVRDEENFKILSSAKGNLYISLLGKIKLFLKNKIEDWIPDPEGGILIAMLMGDREDISIDLQESFAKSGTAHLLAISGLHVGLVASIFIALLKMMRFPRRWCYAVTIVLLIGYCILTGGRASVLRATLMITIFLSAAVFKRETELINSLSWSAILILIFDPFQIFDPGFQLSFLTVFFLGTLTPQLQSLELGFLVSRQQRKSIEFSGSFVWLWLKKILFYFRSYFEVSFSAWIGILPIVAFYFYLFSPVTILANIFVVPYVWLVMAGGFAFLALGSLNDFLAETLGLDAWFLTKIMILLCEGFASIPLAYFRVSPPTPLVFLIYYSLILVWIHRDFLKISNKKFLILLLVFSNLYIWKGVFTSASSQLQITFLDVGHGDAALIEFPGKGKLLVDAGQGIDWDQGRMTIAPFLWNKGITRLDAVLITHPHDDHYGGLKYLLKEFQIGQVWDNGDRAIKLYEEIFPNTEIRRNLKRGDKILGPNNIELLILHPPENFVEDRSVKINDQSLVFQILFGSVGIMMAGDAESFAMQELNSYGARLKSNVLKAPHHGSNEKEDGINFMANIQPEIAVISEAEKNRFNLPSLNVVENLKQQGCKVFQTGFTGAVFFETDGSTYSIRTMLGSHLDRNF